MFCDKIWLALAVSHEELGDHIILQHMYLERLNYTSAELAIDQNN